jgi:hypothetical protein
MDINEYTWICCFATGEGALGIQFIGAWVGPSAGLDSMEK